MENKVKIYVDRDEFMRQMLKCLGSEEYKKSFGELTPAEQTAAMSGMAFCANYACVNTPYVMLQNHKDTYPCNYCGSCPIWLAAFEPNQGIETWEDLIVQCVKRGCDLIGKKVENDA